MVQALLQSSRFAPGYIGSWPAATASHLPRGGHSCARTGRRGGQTDHGRVVCSLTQAVYAHQADCAGEAADPVLLQGPGGVCSRTQAEQHCRQGEGQTQAPPPHHGCRPAPEALHTGVMMGRLLDHPSPGVTAPCARCRMELVPRRKHHDIRPQCLATSPWPQPTLGQGVHCRRLLSPLAVLTKAHSLDVLVNLADLRHPVLLCLVFGVNTGT